jgi:hypothetical protein
MGLFSHYIDEEPKELISIRKHRQQMSQVRLLSRQLGDGSLQMKVNLLDQVLPSLVAAIGLHLVQCEEIRYGRLLPPPTCSAIALQ